VFVSFFPSFVVSFSCVLLCSLNKEKVTAEAGVNDYESWASGGGECVTRGSFGWSKTTPARSFATFGPNFLKIVDAGRKRHGTSLPAPRGEGCFFFRAPLLLHKGPDGPGKPAGLRNGYLLRRGAFATPALKRHRSTNLDTGPEDGLDSSTAPEGRW
jgi:hypothetical protein